MVLINSSSFSAIAASTSPVPPTHFQFQPSAFSLQPLAFPPRRPASTASSRMGLVGLPSSTRAGWESLPASSRAGSENIFDRRNLASLKAVRDDGKWIGGV